MGGTLMLDLIRLFVQVVEEKSYTQVARRLGVSQPAISNQMRVLEEKLGVKLFQRQGKSFTLTQQGEVVLKYTLRILDDWNSLLSELGEDSREVGGKVHIGASHIPGEYLLPEQLSHIQIEQPRITFRISIGDSLEIADKVLSQEVDFAVVGSNFHTEKLESAYWLKDDIRCVVQEGHPLTQLERIQLEDLLEYPMVLREAGSGHRRAIEDALGKIGYHLEDFKIGFEAGSAESVKNAIRSGLGYSFLSMSALNFSNFGLVACEVDGLKIERGFYLLKRRNKTLSRTARYCYDYLAQLEEVE
jgi:LysR family transcriptional regulator, transcriptional activator of the cysJI operon